jgi:hypothetical protein
MTGDSRSDSELLVGLPFSKATAKGIMAEKLKFFRFTTVTVDPARNGDIDPEKWGLLRRIEWSVRVPALWATESQAGDEGGDDNEWES